MRRTRRTASKQTREPVRDIFRQVLGRKKTGGERLAFWLTDSFGTTGFLALNLLLFLLWVGSNQGWIPFFPTFDAYPYGLLTMIVSLEAIVLSIVVLIAQNKAEHLADMRGEIDLEVNVQAEREITKILRMLERIERALHMPVSPDAQLRIMQRQLDLRKIKQHVEKRMLDE